MSDMYDTYSKTLICQPPSYITLLFSNPRCVWCEILAKKMPGIGLRALHALTHLLQCLYEVGTIMFFIIIGYYRLDYWRAERLIAYPWS